MNASEKSPETIKFMISQKIIESLYKKYKKPPKSIDLLNLAVLFDYAARHHDISIDPDTEQLTIGSVDPKSPFRTLSLKRLNGIVPFEEWVALVMPNSIVFLNRRNSDVAVDIRPVSQSLMDRLRTAVGR